MWVQNLHKSCRWNVEKINRSSTDLILWLVPLFKVPVPQDHLKDTKQRLFKAHFIHDCHPAQNLWKFKTKKQINELFLCFWSAYNHVKINTFVRIGLNKRLMWDGTFCQHLSNAFHELKAAKWNLSSACRVKKENHCNHNETSTIALKDLI